MDSQFLNMSCPHCGGGIEFPAHGVGERIACPHCSTDIVLAVPVLIQPSPTRRAVTPTHSASSSSHSSGCMGCALTIAALVFLLLAFIFLIEGTRSLFTPAPKKIPVSAEELGDRWPLTVTSGYIYKRDVSQGRSEVIFVAPDGKEYGLNGVAQSDGYLDIHEITKLENVSYGQEYEDVSELISIGLYGK